MSCCSDIMKPIEASSCCTPKDTAMHAPPKRCVNRIVDAHPWLRIKKN